MRRERSGVRTFFIFWPAPGLPLLPPTALLDGRLEAPFTCGGGVPRLVWLWPFPETPEVIAGWMETLAAASLACSARTCDCRIFFSKTRDISSLRSWVWSCRIKACFSASTSVGNSYKRRCNAWIQSEYKKLERSIESEEKIWRSNVLHIKVRLWHRELSKRELISPLLKLGHPSRRHCSPKKKASVDEIKIDLPSIQACCLLLTKEGSTCVMWRFMIFGRLAGIDCKRKRKPLKRSVRGATRAPFENCHTKHTDDQYYVHTQ